MTNIDDVKQVAETHLNITCHECNTRLVVGDYYINVELTMDDDYHLPICEHCINEMYTNLHVTRHDTPPPKIKSDIQFNYENDY